MINFIKSIRKAASLAEEVEALRKEVRACRKFVNGKVEDMHRHFRVDADIDMRGRNTIVLTGVLGNRAFVRFYDLGGSEFRRLADTLNSMKKDGCIVRHIDAPPTARGGFYL